MLATVNILKPWGKDGKEYMPKIEFDGQGLRQVIRLCMNVRAPCTELFTPACRMMRPFEARIIPRSEDARDLLHSD